MKVNPSKQGLFQSKQGSFGLYIYIYNKYTLPEILKLRLFVDFLKSGPGV